MASPGRSKLVAVLVYTVLRLALFAAVWLTFELLTPIHGIWALVLAILVSGAISLVILDRPRDRVGAAAAGFFGRINERIEASTRAEDDDEPAAPVPDAPTPGDQPAPPIGSGDGQQGAQHHAVDQQ